MLFTASSSFWSLACSSDGCGASTAVFGILHCTGALALIKQWFDLHSVYHTNISIGPDQTDTE
uniref:Uncharacterized protein n=1 Tax=Pristionchus pacificus TaxID=54126 RepID=A0A2A6BNE7_PRIPA|eukprot:PDM67440.1 hypothetical protein PRIPAC_48857 [Pristionchus pacificus]